MDYVFQQSNATGENLRRGALRPRRVVFAKMLDYRPECNDIGCNPENKLGNKIILTTANNQGFPPKCKIQPPASRSIPTLIDPAYSLSYTN